jgi:arginine-tRNA-protein transferase
VTSSLRNLKVYTTYPHSCSYLPEREATTLFVDPRTPMSGSLYSQLSLLGFRRSGSHLYRPNCGSCSACIPARVPVAKFSARRSQRRCWRLNGDVEVRELEDIQSDVAFDLYQRYIETRHHDGDMYPPSREQYQSFLSDEWGVTRFFGMYLENELVGVAVADAMDDGLSAIYTFYEPSLHARSLGTFAVLWQIEAARDLGVNYVYLGYWIKQCTKMAYKTQFRPLELYVNGNWVELL